MLAMDATIYGLPSVYQYVQMHNQAVDRASPTYTGFDEFDHQRDVATPDFNAFRTPNVDTLYSNAWLDLTGGHCSLHVPPIGERYYTLHFLDMYANATNLSSRTVGPGGGDFLVVPPGWSGSSDPGVTVFRVASPYMWILMRILVGSRRTISATSVAFRTGSRLRPRGAVGTASSCHHPGCGRGRVERLLRGPRLHDPARAGIPRKRPPTRTGSERSGWAIPTAHSMRRSSTMRRSAASRQASTTRTPSSGPPAFRSGSNARRAGRRAPQGSRASTICAARPELSSARAETSVRRRSSSSPSRPNRAPSSTDRGPTTASASHRRRRRRTGH